MRSNASFPPIPDIEVPEQKESFAEFSGSFSNSSCSSVANGEYEDEPNSMDVSDALCTSTHIPLASTTNGYPIPHGFGDCNSVGQFPHSWHPGLDGRYSESPPRHKPLSQSFSYNCSGDGERTRRRSFSKRKHTDKCSVPVEECGGTDSMDCEMKEKKSCRKSVLPGDFGDQFTQYPPNFNRWLSPESQSITQRQERSQFLQLPNPLPYVSTNLTQNGNSPDVHRLSEPSFGTNFLDPALSRSL